MNNQATSRNLFDEAVPFLPSVDIAAEIVKYELPHRITWGKLVEKDTTGGRRVNIGTIRGEPAWSDGFMLEVADVPPQLKKLKGYFEMLGKDDKPREFDHLIPDIPPGSPNVEPLALITAGDARPDIVYLATPAHPRYEITIQKKYIDYFRIRYPVCRFIIITSHSPLVVKQGADIIGLIMPIYVAEDILQQVRDFLGPAPLPPPKEPVGITREQVIDFDRAHTLDEIKQMARDKGLSPSGTKHQIIERLLES